MIDFRTSSDCKTVIVWQGESCTATVDLGTVDATSAVQLNILLRKLGTHPKIHLEFNEYKNAIVQWRSTVTGGRESLSRSPVIRDLFVGKALDAANQLSWDIRDYNHHCAIVAAAEEARAA